jgi:hypothetical protein
MNDVVGWSPIMVTWRARRTRRIPIRLTGCADLDRLEPGYVSRRPYHLAIAARLMGYRRAEALAYVYPRAKTVVGLRA